MNYRYNFFLKYNKNSHIDLYVSPIICYLVDFDKLDNLSSLSFNYSIINDHYINNDNLTLVEKIYNINLKTHSIIYKNKNEYDLRYDMILIKYKPIPIINITIINKPITIGNNIYYEIHNDIKNDIYWVINIGDKFILIDTIISNLLLKSIYKYQIWKINNNIVSTKQLSSINNKLVYNEINMHAFIYCFYSNIKYDNDINISKFSNSLDINIINYRQNNINYIIKKNRKFNAKKLPIELGNIQLPKYIVYYNENNKQNNTEKQYFKIENHPKLLKPWISTTKNNIPIIDKYNQTIQKLHDLINE
jgi:hypothetical protein